MIVQDLGLARLIRAITPDLEIHASTQMSITSEEGVRLAAELGCSRVILARELSLAEVAAGPGRIVAAGRGVRPRGALRGLFGPVPDQRGPRRPIRQPGRVRPGLPDALRDRLRRPGRRPGQDAVPAQPAGPRRFRPGPRPDPGGRRQPEDRRAAQGPRVRGQHHPALPPGDRRGLGRTARRVLAARGRGDAALVLPRLQPRLPRRREPQGAGSRRLRQEARDLARRGRVGRSSGRSDVGRLARSSRATAWSSTATRRRAFPSKAAGSTRSSPPMERRPRRRSGSNCDSAGTRSICFGSIPASGSGRPTIPN